MKYLMGCFSIDCPEELKQVCKDLLADSLAEAGFESFEETEHGLNGYVNADLFDEEAMREAINLFPIEGAKIRGEDKRENGGSRGQGLE